MKTKERNLKAANITLKDEVTRLLKVSTPKSPLLEHRSSSGSLNMSSNKSPSIRRRSSWSNPHLYESVDLTYLRNVILQFILDKSKRPLLIKAIGTILQCSEDEIKKINSAKL
jgi:hypothetical protein